MKNIAQPTNEIKQVTKNTSILTLTKHAKNAEGSCFVL